MRVAELSAFHVQIPLRSTIRHASHTRQANNTLIIRCRLDDGTEGWGEGLPRPYVTGESIETALAQLQATPITAQLGAPFDDLRGAMALCERLELALPEEVVVGRESFLERGCLGNSLRCAIELSVLDAATRASRVPLATITSLVPETVAIRGWQDEVRYSGTITGMPAWKQFVRAAAMRWLGFEQIKVKVGLDGFDDRVVLKWVRRAAGKAIDLRIDANEAWSCETLEENFDALRPLGVSAVEQPVPHAQVDGLSGLPRSVRASIVLDESLCSEGDAQRAIERSTCGLFNIRLSKCGGFLPSLKLAAMAHRAGLGYQLGCQVGETGILSAAGRHFATSVAGIRYQEGSYDRYLVRERLTVEDVTFGRGGLAHALSGPGLGVTIDAEALRRVTLAKQQWSLA